MFWSGFDVDTNLMPTSRPRLRNASGTTEPSGSEAKLRVDLESQLTLQYVPGLVLVLVKVQRRAIVRCDDVLERSQVPFGAP